MFHSIINPFIYYNQNKRIHEAINQLFYLLPCISTNPRRTSATFATDEHRKLQKTNGTKAIRAVNMIAYMPVANEEEKTINSTTINSTTINSHSTNKKKNVNNVVEQHKVAS